MEISLDEYIAHKPTLQAAIVGARMRGKYDRRVHNSEEFKAESQQYISTEKESSKDYVSILDGPTFEEAYLTLDLNDDDEFDEMYDQLNSNLTTETAVDKSVITQQKAKSHNNESVKISSDEEVNNLLKQSGFDLRQVVQERQQSDSQQWRLKAPSVNVRRPIGLPSLVPKFCFNNNKKSNRPKQQRKCNNNRISRKNIPYQKRRFGNGNYGTDNGSVDYANANSNSHCSNRSQFWSNSSVFNPIANSNGCRLGLNACCNHHGVSLPVNNCNCNRNTFKEIGFDIDMNRVGENRAGLMPSGCNLIGYNGSGFINPSLGCTRADLCFRFNNDFNPNKLNKLLNNETNFIAGTNSHICQRRNVFNAMAENLFEKPNCREFFKNSQNLNISADSSLNNGEQVNAAMDDIRDLNNGNTSKKSPMQGKNIASALGINQKDLEMDSVPVMLTMMQQILQNGITIKLFPFKGDQFNVLNTQKTSENMQM